LISSSERSCAGAFGTAVSDIVAAMPPATKPGVFTLASSSPLLFSTALLEWGQKCAGNPPLPIQPDGTPSAAN
jgi:hypothetical protein